MVSLLLVGIVILVGTIHFRFEQLDPSGKSGPVFSEAYWARWAQTGGTSYFPLKIQVLRD